MVTRERTGRAWTLIMREWRPDALLIGLPLTWMAPNSRPAAPRAPLLARWANAIGLAVHLVDERLSSQEAARRFAERRAHGETRRKHAQALDAIAAEIIIETWLSAAGDGSLVSVPD